MVRARQLISRPSSASADAAHDGIGAANSAAIAAPATSRPARFREIITALHSVSAHADKRTFPR
jgi:hypothetical protein